MPRYFYPRPPRGGRQSRRKADGCPFQFLSTPSARRATAVTQTGSVTSVNFYPRPPRGGRRASTARRLSFMQFLSTPSARRATKRGGQAMLKVNDFYPRPLRGGRHVQDVETGEVIQISIHALCEEGDLVGGVGGLHEKISIHALCEEGDGGCALRPLLRSISIHALCEEGDPMCPRYVHPSSRFLSTPSARRATPGVLLALTLICDFYPRPLRGGRPMMNGYCLSRLLFLSTPSARRATLLNLYSHAST